MKSLEINEGIVNSNLPSIHKAFDFAWETLKKQFGLFAAIMLTLLRRG